MNLKFISNKKANLGMLAITVALAALLTFGAVMTGCSFVHCLKLGDYSDAMRQWEVCQYVKARINPYELAFRLLHDTFGPATGPQRIKMKETRIYSVNTAHWRGEPGILPGHPPPEATYPPSTISLLVPTVGFLSKSLLLPTFAIANLMVLSILVLVLSRWTRVSTGLSLPSAFSLAAAVCLCWPPVSFAVQNGQSCVLVLLCALVSVWTMPRHPFLAGIFLMLALLKPSMSLLFAFIPLVRWKWCTLWTTFVLGLLLTFAPCLWLGEWPWGLLSQWMGLCRYVLQGAFTLQEVFNALAIENTIWSTTAILILWGGILACCIRFRRARWEWLFALLALSNLAWTYHERHDFALLAFPVLLFVADAIAGRHRCLALMGLALYVVLGAALSDCFYIPATAWANLVRWMGRLALTALWPVTLVRLRYSAREDAPSDSPMSLSRVA